MICLTRNDLNPLMMAVEASASAILVCNPFLSSSPTTTYKAVALQKALHLVDWLNPEGTPIGTGYSLATDCGAIIGFRRAV